MRGDKLASGAATATFLGPLLKFDEAEMRRELKLLPASAFMEKYMVTQREYDLLVGSDGEISVNAFAEQMRRQNEFYQRGMDADAAQAASLERKCFLEPFELHLLGYTGRVIVDRDEPASPKGDVGRLLIPRSLRKEKTLLPTTGHILKAFIVRPDGTPCGPDFIGRRVLFNQMSGSAICFQNYPTWVLLELSEILCWVPKDAADAKVTEESLEPMV
jgi:hypothetical protein